jgi:hypothetical protein
MRASRVLLLLAAALLLAIAGVQAQVLGQFAST